MMDEEKDTPVDEDGEETGNNEGTATDTPPTAEPTE